MPNSRLTRAITDDINDCFAFGIALGKALGQTIRIFEQYRAQRLEMLRWFRNQWAK